MSPFTRREEDLQKLLQEERKRSEQRKINYQNLKSEHLKLQEQYLNLQAEMKQILEETVYFKDKKNIEVDELLKQIEMKTKQIEKLEQNLRENDPEVIRIKLLDELEQPIRKLEKDKEKLEREREKLQNELKLCRQQMEHQEKEHLDSLEKVKLSYEVELNLIKREKEELRIRLVEASQVPDVKKLIDLSEENGRLQRKLQQAQEIIEQAQQKYRQIQQQIEDLIREQEQKEHDNEIRIQKHVEQCNQLKQQVKNFRAEIQQKSQENDELQKEINHLKRSQEKLRFDLEQQKILHETEKEAIVAKMNNEIQLLNQTKLDLKNEIKKLKDIIQDKSETITTLERTIEMKEKEFQERITAAIGVESEKLLKLEHEKKSLELTIEDLNREKRQQSLDIEKLKNQLNQLMELKNVQERETLLLRAKLDSQTLAIEELEKIRRQHVALHEETNRLKLEQLDLIATNKELQRINQNMREEIQRIREQLDEERRHLEELNISNEKILSKISTRFEMEQQDLLDKIKLLEKENLKLKQQIATGIGNPQQQQQVKQSKDYYYQISRNDYSRLKAKQYAKITDRLNSLLEQLQPQQQNDLINQEMNNPGSSKNLNQNNQR